MRNTIKFVMTIVVFTIISMFVLDILYTQFYKHGIPRSKLAYVKSIRNKHYGYIFIGSSRVDNFIDSKVIEDVTNKPAINLGLAGAKIEDYLLLMKILKKQNITADSILVQIDYVYNISGASKIPMSNLLQYIEDPNIQEFVKEKHPEYLYLKYVPFYRYMVNDFKTGLREFTLVVVGKQPRIDYSSGFAPLYHPTVKNLKTNLPSSLGKTNQTFEDLKSFANNNSINIAFFTSPLCKNVSNKNYIKSLAIRIPGLMDYSQLLREDYYFTDCSHVNYKGAKVFSTLFAHDLIKNNPQ